MPKDESVTEPTEIPDKRLLVAIITSGILAKDGIMGWEQTVKTAEQIAERILQPPKRRIT